MKLLTIKQFVDKYTGQAIDYDGQYGAQCVDLFNFYNKEVVGAPWIGTPVSGGARDLYEVKNAARDKFYKKLPANAEIQPGDVEVYGYPHGRFIVNGKPIYLGHVAIYIGNGKVINQNGKRPQTTTIDDRIRVGRLGILRPLHQSQQTPEPQKPAPKSIPVKHNSVKSAVGVTSYYQIKKGDTFWGLESGWSMKHGTLQRLNPGINPKALQIGQRIRKS
mgnify:CR=1 FL=1